MKILVTGACGQLGSDVINVLTKNSFNAIGIDIHDVDLLDFNGTKSLVFGINPDVIIHCAAYTAVDLAEKEHQICMDINANSTENIAKIAREINAKMVYISTDYVFSGNDNQPHNEYEKPNPINFYGKSKLLGEKFVQENLEKYFIVRTSWVFGKNGNNFVNKMLNISKEKSEIAVVSDQIGSPTYTVHLAYFIAELVKTDKYGIYHATGSGHCSWDEFARKIFELMSIDIRIRKISSAEFPAAAKRPYNSRLSNNTLIKSGFKTLPNWEIGLEEYLKNNLE